ncbi:fimbria/pilus periplasmic chaperone [Oleiagrimonas sp. MCCC 1A03011]|uniref:fimbrial biogenesis chaperone n=1 Tax=Oleiagrimonas sp. MCCC 1A03011 TaxID=1926883 RepID=UPI000DC411BD|nr:fimbria/pilus periplasmic chaperone [Oleiagrimonas sp. MCCC 1A03011]RAP59342.1 hypothetical protein BTJ49_01345 [Oleiagrimonas sp. MCCC 1A03011]
MLSVAFAATAPVHAGSLAVAPTSLRLPANGGTAVMYAFNRGDHPVIVQVEGYVWSQHDNADHLASTDRLQRSPPMARIAPGQKQTIRVRVPPSAAKRERTFRLLVSELPDPNNERANSVRVLLQFSVPVFVASGKDSHPALTWRARREADGIRLSVRNDGSGYAKLVNLVTVSPNGKRTPVLSKSLKYVLSGAERSWMLPATTSRKLVIEGKELHGDTALHVTVAVRQ